MIPASQLEAAREQWEFDLDLALAVHSELERELTKATGHLARLKEELIARGLSEILWGTHHEVTAAIPDEVQDTSEAVLAAQTYLSQWLAVPPCSTDSRTEVSTPNECSTRRQPASRCQTTTPPRRWPSGSTS